MESKGREEKKKTKEIKVLERRIEMLTGGKGREEKKGRKFWGGVYSRGQREEREGK